MSAPRTWLLVLLGIVAVGAAVPATLALGPLAVVWVPAYAVVYFYLYGFPGRWALTVVVLVLGGFVTLGVECVLVQAGVVMTGPVLSRLVPLGLWLSSSAVLTLTLRRHQARTAGGRNPTHDPDPPTSTPR
jgi:hypothetical protein